MKVLIVNASYPPNIVAGAERVVLSLAAQLRGSGHEVIVVTTQPEGPGVIGEVEGATVHYVPVRNLYRPFGGAQPGKLSKVVWHAFDTYNFLMAHEVGRIIDAARPDVVNTHNLPGFSAAVFRAVRKRNVPLVHTLHDQYLLCVRGTMFKGDRNCTRQCMECRVAGLPRRAASQLVDVAMGVSRFILERHLRHGYFRGAEPRVVYNGVGSNGAPSELRSRAHQGFRFGFLGQIRSTKGLHRLIDAFLAECSTEAQLWIAGKGDPGYEAELRGRTATEGSISWRGFVKTSEFLEEVDVLVVPSLWHDTAPLVVLEAFRQGVPVLGSGRGGIPEFITADSGWMFDPDDPADLRRALRRCLQQRSRLSEMGRAAYAQTRNFDTARFIGGYLDAYGQAASRARLSGEAG